MVARSLGWGSTWTTVGKSSSRIDQWSWFEKENDRSVITYHTDDEQVEFDRLDSSIDGPADGFYDPGQEDVTTIPLGNACGRNDPSFASSSTDPRSRYLATMGAG
jgi:hypothetical protein